MSAFVVDNETINRIVKAIEIGNDRQPYPEKFPNLQYLDSDMLANMVREPEQLGKTMLAMNVNAVEQRYPDHDDPEYPYIYNVPVFSRPDPVQVFKSLECYLYQCSEGDVPGLPLFKALTAYKNALAVQIVGNLPEYETAQWG